MSPSACDLQRFHTAQGDGAGSIYARALRELRAGGKQSHWIWFVLPQRRGLGRSAMAERYGIGDLAEARSYLADPVLRELKQWDFAQVPIHRSTKARRENTQGLE